MKTKLEVGKTYQTNPNEEFLIVGIEEKINSVFLKKLNTRNDMNEYLLTTLEDLIDIFKTKKIKCEYIGTIQFDLEIFESMAIEIIY